MIDMKLANSSKFHAFTLIELLFAMVVIGMLLLVGISAVNGSRFYGRRVCVDELVGIFDQARSRAIIRHRPIIVALIDPSDVDGAGTTRVGLYQMDEWPVLLAEPLETERVNSWWFTHPGVEIVGGSDDGLINPRDAAELRLRETSDSVVMRVHAVVFNAQGQIIYPAGIEPVEVLTTGGEVIDNQIRVGRMTGRCYALSP